MLSREKGENYSYILASNMQPPSLSNQLRIPKNSCQNIIPNGTLYTQHCWDQHTFKPSSYGTHLQTCKVFDIFNILDKAWRNETKYWISSPNPWFTSNKFQTPQITLVYPTQHGKEMEQFMV